MGKGRDKKKKNRASAGVKKAHNQARREELNEGKRERREEKATKGGEDDIQALLAQVALKEKQIKQVKVTDNVDPPSARCNCTLTALGGQALAGTKHKHDVLLYGGEFYDGRKTYVYGDLYKYDVKKGIWSLIQCKKPPKPRSGHQSFAYKGYFYTFGGEYTSPNQKNFNHYRDLWRLDVSSWEWEQLSIKGGPSARSGHRIVQVKGKAYMFGGFYDTGKELKYYSDLWVFDIENLKWESFGVPGQLAPSARSGCQIFADETQNKVYVYGGYSKVLDDDDEEHGVTHDDMWGLDLNTLRWEKIKRAGVVPGKRAGATIVVHKRNAVMFGGVIDHESENGEVLVSEFFNDMFNFQLDKRRWFPMTIRPPGASISKQEQQQNSVIIVKGDAQEAAAALKIQAHFRGYSVRKAYKLYKIGGKVNELLYSPAVCKMNTSKIIYPTPRIKANMTVIDNVLWLYGGSFEDKDQELTLDDLWSINLNKLDGWNCIFKGTFDKSQWEGSDDELEEDDLEAMEDLEAMDIDDDSDDLSE